MIISNKKFKIIYADPPWGYANKPSKNGTSRGFAGNHYSLMNLDEIKNLPVSEIADDDSVLFMWSTFPMIMDALETIKAWGFSYRTCAFVWVKKTSKGSNFWGCGYYTRSNAEICLLATKGKTLHRCSHSVHQIIESIPEKHSKKPDVVRSKIIELFGELPRIELFARERVEGWECWGDEITEPYKEGEVNDNTM